MTDYEKTKTRLRCLEMAIDTAKCCGHLSDTNKITHEAETYYAFIADEQHPALDTFLPERFPL